MWRSGACFSKEPILFGPILAATISFISLQCRGSEPSNFEILLVFVTLKNMLKDQLFKTSGLQFDNWLFEPKRFYGSIKVAHTLEE